MLTVTRLGIRHREASAATMRARNRIPRAAAIAHPPQRCISHGTPLPVINEIGRGVTTTHTSRQEPSRITLSQAISQAKVEQQEPHCQHP
jgi:hypothetical protein